MTSKRIMLIALAAGFLQAAAGQAMAANGVNVGVLKCTVDGGVGLIFGSSKDMICRFEPSGGGPPVPYHGSVTKVGIDIGVTERSYITWVVFAPGKLKATALAGTYVGATADAAIGVGLGANVLVGGFEKSIALQPLSVSGEEGLNVAIGIGAMDLKPGP